MDIASFRNYVVQAFYKVGVIGIKLESYESYLWAHGCKRAVSASEIGDDTQIAVHPAFWRVLGIGVG